MYPEIDFDYICMVLSNISGLPVRMYSRENLAVFYSNVSLSVDPITPYLTKVYSATERVGFFSTRHEYYYGVLNFGADKIVIGPSRLVPPEENELREIAFEIGVTKQNVDAFLRAMKSLPRLPASGIIQILFLVNHFISGEKLSLTDLYVSDDAQEKLVESMHKEVAQSDEIEDSPHGTMDIENLMMGCVSRGDVEGLKKLFSSMPAIKSGVIAKNEVRQSKNTLIVAATLVSRAAAQGGMDLNEAMTLSDKYIQKCELANKIEDVMSLNYRMVMDYAERVAKLRSCCHNGSALAMQVTNYVKKHLSEPVSVEALAEHLHRSRSRLSTVFKQETGENLSDFILNQKIEESMNLLRYSDRPIADIAYYLGFSSQSHFTRTFKKYAGVTPNEFRKSY